MELRFYRGKIVTVNKTSRGKFPISVAEAGDRGIVITTWFSSMGTGKLTILKEDGSTRGTTLSCVSIDEKQPESKNEISLWDRVKKAHDVKNSIPVIVVCLNAGKKAYRVKSLNNRVFFYKHGGNVTHKKGDCFTLNIPIWLARKEGILPD